MAITLTTFGYKYGLPMDADLVFDARFLPNPFHIAELRSLGGDDPPVENYLNQFPITGQFLEQLKKLLDFLIPSFKNEGKSYLNIAIGCTGGRHRSVFIAKQIQEYLNSKDNDIRLVNRDIGKE